MLPILQHLPHFRLSPPFSPPAYVNAPRHSSSALCSLLFPSPVRPLWGGPLVVRTPRPVCERKRKRKRMAPRWHGFPLYRTFSSFHAGRWAQTGRRSTSTSRGRRQNGVQRAPNRETLRWLDGLGLACSRKLWPYWRQPPDLPILVPEKRCWPIWPYYS